MVCRKEEQRIDGCTFNRRIVKGLMNIGNTCFFNSVMQNLLAVDLFRDHFMKPAQFPEGPITSALRKLYAKTSTDGSKQGDDDDVDSWSKGNEAVNPAFLFMAICAKVRQFRGFGQQDSHELLRCLLDNLDSEELAILRNSKSTDWGDGDAAEGNTDERSNQRNNATLVDRVFQGQLCSTISCSKCGHCSVTYEPFYDLSLSLPSKPEDMKVSLPSQNDPSSSKTKLKNDEATTSHEDIWDLFDYDGDEAAAAAGSSVVEGKNIADCESESLLYGGNGGDNLFKVMPVTTETLEDRKAAVIPISVEGCLVEFTRLESLSGENGWRCPNCASKLVNASDNLENATGKEEQGLEFSGKLNAKSVNDSSAQGVSCSDAEGRSNKNVLRIFGSTDRSLIDGIKNAERPESTSSEEESDRTTANLGKWDLESQNITSSEEGHRQNEANLNGISEEATKRYLISKAPPVLTIHLKRFKHGSSGRLKKLSDHVAFQETLDLRPCMDSSSPDTEDFLYRLIGVVEHEGTMGSGHYVAYVRGDQDGSVRQWFNISDSFVMKVSSRVVLGSEAYILFYEKYIM